MKPKALHHELFFSKTNDFLNLYLPEQAMRSKNTITTYRDGLTVFRRYIADEMKQSLRTFKFKDCTHDFLLEYMAYLKESGLAETTCNNRLATIRAYLWYVADGDISMQSVALGASRVPFLRTIKKVKEIISEDDFSALLSAPSNKTRFGLRDRTLMILLYDTAIRVSELLDIKISNLYINEPIPYIRIHGKGDKERAVAITDKTVEHLNVYLKVFHPDMTDRPLFYTVIKGSLSSMSTGNVERIIKKYAEIVRVDHPHLPQKVHPHMFRRTRATNLYQNGIELELVSRILGHTSTQTTRIYATPSMEMLKVAMGATTEGIPEEEALWLNDESELARLCGLR
ncbi:Integrase [Petrocella atlantisensis]|uniref:Integrase n=1 Tax=Petrocella atlantisensis TaxID=2173034 RepID=A0A3P7PXR2_9FIRM|nr:tyrosine-type recombinase/integrase [Petrocella atlantisensis]VDN47971.1 Integrase [Petrocella atlantisensis]